MYADKSIHIAPAFRRILLATCVSAAFVLGPTLNAPAHTIHANESPNQPAGMRPVTGLVTVGCGQTARLNVVNVSQGPVEVELLLLDGMSEPLVRDRQMLDPGQSTRLEYDLPVMLPSPGEPTGANDLCPLGRAQTIRAEVLLIPDRNRRPIVGQPLTITVVSSMEIVEDRILSHEDHEMLVEKTVLYVPFLPQDFQ